MTQLTVHSDSVMGPLEVAVHGPEGESAEFVLSSGKMHNTIPVRPGRYAIIARRPNGSRLRQSIEVGDKDEHIYLMASVGSSPNEFMWAETGRGQVALDPAPSTEAPWRSTLAGAAGEALGSAALEMAGTRAAAPSLKAAEDIAQDVLRKRRAHEVLSLQVWQLDAHGWAGAAAGPKLDDVVGQAAVSSEFLKLWIRPGQAPLAVGLMNDKGNGPIVCVPPFRDPVEITFLARSLVVQASDRTLIPGGQRVPVALVTPTNPAVADLLGALAASATPAAAELWQQSAPGLAPGAGMAEELLMGKFEAPAEALVAAHYLLRFMPSRLPVGWADNLKLAMRRAADGPAIAAWARILNRPAYLTDDALEREVGENVAQALEQPVTLFARTRALLIDALRLLPQDDTSMAVALERRSRRFGAEAGGLEAFWGGGPSLPGLPSPAARGVAMAELTLVEGAFNGMPPGLGAALPRPESAEAETAGEAEEDDLQLLKGVGPKFVSRLHEVGITRFDQLAALGDRELGKLEVRLGTFGRRLRRDRLTEQADYLARGDVEGFEARFGEASEEG